MAQELELSDQYATIHELQGTQINRRGTEQSGRSTSASPTKRRLLTIGILTLGVLCLLQATLNISLRLAFRSKEDADGFPFNSSFIEDVCKIHPSQQNSTQSCSCCKNLLRKLLREYQALETERDILRDKLETRGVDPVQESGSGSLEEFFASEISGYS